MHANSSRREFLSGSSLAAAAIALAPWSASGRAAAAPRSPNDRWRVGCIGMRYQGSVVARAIRPYGDVVAICDVDRHVREQARASFNSEAPIYEDYRDLLARDDVDVVVIAAPDHWHVKMALDACRAGKDVYCEKPVSLTIDEGRKLVDVVRQTGRVLQVGSWQRSDGRFRLAAEMVRAGRLGRIQKITVVLGKNERGGPFERTPAPKHLNWNLWQGQAPERVYLPERCHYTFRWWREYAGGEMTDSGAHDLDIALWMLGELAAGPVEIEGRATFPDVREGYNVPLDYTATFRFAAGAELHVLDAPSGEADRKGLLVEGESGRIFVNRGVLAGKPVEELAARPLSRGDYRLYAHDNLDRAEQFGKFDAIGAHLGNFYDGTVSRQPPISDVESQHRSAAFCHLGNIALELGRKLTWNESTERFEGEFASDANARLSREQRSGFEVR